MVDHSGAGNSPIFDLTNDKVSARIRYTSKEELC